MIVIQNMHEVKQRARSYLQRRLVNVTRPDKMVSWHYIFLYPSKIGIIHFKTLFFSPRSSSCALCACVTQPHMQDVICQYLLNTEKTAQSSFKKWTPKFMKHLSGIKIMTWVIDRFVWHSYHELNNRLFCRVFRLFSCVKMTQDQFNSWQKVVFF